MALNEEKTRKYVEENFKKLLEYLEKVLEAAPAHLSVSIAYVKVCWNQNLGTKIYFLIL